MTRLPAATGRDSAWLWERLEVIDDPQPRPAAFNMAADESLLEHLGDCAVLRMYRWLRPAVSFGYFTAYEAVRRHHRQRELVRRWTGGGIVEHGEDFTYSLLIPRGSSAIFGAAARSYEMVHGAVAKALSGAGFSVSLSRGNQQTEPAAFGAYCFERPVTHDLMIADRKTAGAAQRRTRRGLLHQGSVQGIGDRKDWREVLAENLPGAFARSPLGRPFTASEQEWAARLAETKYGAEEWLHRF